MDAIEHLAKKYSLNKLFFSTILIGLSAALPEIGIALSAGFENKPLIALGNVYGANLANLGLVVGIAVIVAGVVPIVGEYVRGSLWVTLGAIILPYMLMLDGGLSRLDGLILLLGYLLYLNYVVKTNGIIVKQKKNLKRLEKVSKEEIMTPVSSSLVMLVLGLATILVSALFLVRLVGSIAIDLKVSDFWAGIIFLSLGTTLPEIFGGIESDKKFTSLLVVEKLLGSVVINSTLVIGVLAIIRPISTNETLASGLTGLFTVITLGLFWLFSKSKRKLSRWEGVVLVGVYMMFAGLMLLTAR